MTQKMTTAQTQKSKAQRLAKINKDRKFLMKLLAKLRKQINALRVDKTKNHSDCVMLLKRRNDYRKRLTKLTRKRHIVRREPDSP